MFPRLNKIGIGALLLGLAFLAAQFHFCADLNSGPASSHPCQICSTVGTAVTPHTLTLAVVPVVSRVEVLVTVVSPLVEFPRTTSPRAPPSL